MNKIDGQKENWDDIWSTSNKLNWFGRRLRNAQIKTLKKILTEINLSHDAKILDMGCGSGRSLFDLRKLGYNNSFGIDTSSKSIELCERTGFLRDKDVFLMDGTNTTCNDDEFYMVSSQGLLEHFEDFTPFVKEMTRISNRYVLLFQPNHFSLYRKIIDAVSGTPVDEYTCYGVKEYVEKFEKFDWKLVHRVGYNLNEQFALLFEKNMSRKYNMGVLFPNVNGVSQLFLKQYISIFKSLSDSIFVISRDGIYQCNNGWIVDSKIETSEATKSILIRIPKAIISEFKIFLRTLIILPRIDLLFFNSPVIGNLLFPQLIAKISAKKLILITGGTGSECVSGTYDRAFFGLGKYFLSMIVNIIEKVNYGLADTIVVFSESEIHKKPGLKKHSQKVMCQGRRFVDNKIFRVEKDLSQREIKVGFIGRFAQEKGINNFIEVIPHILNNREDVNFLIIGDGPQLVDVKNSLKKMNLQAKVELLNWISHDKMGGYLNELKLLVIPSYTEGLPNTLLEAMACGTPVLATPVGTIPDVIKDGETGFIMENNSPECIGENIMKALEDPNLDEIAENAKKIITREFTYEAAVKRYTKIFDNISRTKRSVLICG